MNKGELVTALAEKAGITQDQAKASLNGIQDIIKAELAAGNKVTMVGFGTFEARDRKARIGRNPRTGAEIKIAACKAPAFKPGSEFKKAVN